MAIPDYATKVHEWIIVDIYQWEQEMFDWSFRTFEMAKRPDGVYCIPVFWDKICMWHDKQPGIDWWITLLWWRVDKWLSLVETMREELSEEWWISYETLELHTSFTVPWKMEYSQHIFIARWCVVDHNTHPDVWWEDIELHYLSFDEFVDIAIQSDDLIMFSNYIMRIKLENKLDDFRNLLFN